ncbi:MAG: hypothetical protein JWP89_886 [Schlesneria sp.]|nr:hypothetical protein [Schlesneria sp.]
MTRIRFAPKQKLRRGFTLIELLVVISIIAVLASLIAPAVQSARRAARKLECLNNIRNCSLAIQNFASQNGGQLPPLQTSMDVGTPTTTIAVGWPVSILPALDAGALYRSIKGTSSNISGTAQAVWIPAFTCPDDQDSFRQPGGLSYVANSGFISSSIWGVVGGDGAGSSYHDPCTLDWGAGASGTSSATTAVIVAKLVANANVEVATGAMWRLPTDGGSGQGLVRQAFSFQPSIDYIGTGDGTGNTLLLTENLNAGQWYGADVNSIGFGLRVDATGGVPAAGQFVSTSSLATTLDAYNLNTYWFINRPQQAGMSAPRPSSQHIGGVNVMMCDGSGKFVSENISKDVFAKLLTSNGVTYGEVTLNPSSY